MRVLLLVGTLLLAGCPHEAGKRCMSNLHYLKDTKTSLCYATCGSPAGKSFSFTYVPCTDEVVKAIQREADYYER